MAAAPAEGASNNPFYMEEDDYIESFASAEDGGKGSDEGTEASRAENAGNDEIRVVLPLQGESAAACADVLTFDSIAGRLLKERLILTALELHMELLESGRELTRLRDFFSNPANFERMRLGEGSPPRLGVLRVYLLLDLGSMAYYK